MKVGYWVDLTAHQFDDESGAAWIQALPLGTYDHPLYGTIDVTPGRVARFASNVNNKVRGQDLDIDYDHKEHSGRAAGWVTAADARTGRRRRQRGERVPREAPQGAQAE
jgi:hypothetical protein